MHSDLKKQKQNWEGFNAEHFMKISGKLFNFFIWMKNFRLKDFTVQLSQVLSNLKSCTSYLLVRGLINLRDHDFRKVNVSKKVTC